MNNLEIWDRVKQPPKDALKTIGGGRLKGMTDINPQWRLKVMTEIFGPCGTGWKYEIVRLWNEQGAGEEKAAFALVDVYYKQGEEWSAPVPGVGGNALIARESSGPRTNDESYKMAVTDAISTALKALGVGADIYAGKWDGSRYNVPQEPQAPLVNIPAQQKTEFATQVRACLADGDEHGLRQLWAEWEPDEKVVLWGLFNSQERSAMKKYENKEDLK